MSAILVVVFYCFSAVQSYEADEKRALKLWNDKWETQVAPYIAQCEQVTDLTDLTLDSSLASRRNGYWQQRLYRGKLIPVGNVTLRSFFNHCLPLRK